MVAAALCMDVARSFVFPVPPTIPSRAHAHAAGSSPTSCSARAQRVSILLAVPDNLEISKAGSRYYLLEHWLPSVRHAACTYPVVFW